MSDGKRIMIVVVLMTLVLIGMVAKKQYTLNTGELVLLKTEPVDPRSLFRGDYVRLDYQISRLEKSRFPIVSRLKHNDTVYVVLKQEGEYRVAAAVALAMPETAPGMVVIRGRVHMPWLRGRTGDSHVMVKYGIENYFVPEGEGLQLERLRNRQKVSMQIAVDAFGNAGIKTVLVNGEPYYTETLF